MYCKYCEKPIQQKRTGTKNGKPVFRKFCDRSCAASYNNTKFPKRQLEGNCSICNTPCSNSRKYCPQCNPWSPHHWETVTIQQVHGRAKYQKSARIRQHARKIMNDSGVEKKCRVCNYNIHVEVSHIRAINDFPETALIKEVNSLNNLEYLCRNHHWEHEHGLI